MVLPLPQSGWLVVCLGTFSDGLVISAVWSFGGAIDRSVSAMREQQRAGGASCELRSTPSTGDGCAGGAVSVGCERGLRAWAA